MRSFLALLCTLLLPAIAPAQTIPAFPGAEGFGAMTTTGGRGGQVIYVTNLNPSGPGSFNEALNTPGPRYILFKVGGLIDAAAELYYGDVTIAGQTAPGGLLVRGFVVDEVYDTVGTGNNIILRHLRSRPHDPALYPSPNYILDDGLRLDGARDVVIDHCSFENAIDEAVQISQTSRLSFQNNLLAETIGSHFDLGGMLLNYTTPEHPQDSISIHHNIWNRLGGRLPELSNESPYAAQRRLNLELSCNLIWDQAINIWYNAGIDPAASTPIDSFFLNLNWVNNFSMARPAFGNGMISHDLLGVAANNIYASGNKMNLYPAYSDYELFYCCNDFPQPGNNPNTDLGVANLLPIRLPFPAVTYDAATSLTGYMQGKAGAFPRDSMDRRLMQPLATGIIDPTPIDDQVHYSDAYITAAAPAAPADADNDGMPDYWESAHGLNPAVQDHNGTNLSVSIAGAAGYTNLECYLNCLSDMLVTGSSTGACGISLVASGIAPVQRRTCIYPNPAASLLQVSFPQSGYSLSITDVLGRTVLVRTGCPQTMAIPLSLPAGVYQCLVAGAQGTQESIRLVVVE